MLMFSLAKHIQDPCCHLVSENDSLFILISLNPLLEDDPCFEFKLMAFIDNHLISQH